MFSGVAGELPRVFVHAFGGLRFERELTLGVGDRLAGLDGGELIFTDAAVDDLFAAGLGVKEP